MARRLKIRDCPSKTRLDEKSRAFGRPEAVAQGPNNSRDDIWPCPPVPLNSRPMSDALMTVTLAFEWRQAATGLLMVLFIAACLLLILAILIQKPQGGGLAGAFGSGSGSGNTAFGARTGDALTVITISMFVLYLVSGIALGFAARPQTDAKPEEAISAPATTTPATTLPAGTTPAATPGATPAAAPAAAPGTATPAPVDPAAAPATAPAPAPVPAPVNGG